MKTNESGNWAKDVYKRQWLYECEKSNGTIKQYRHYIVLFMQYMNGKSVEKNDVIMWKGILREKLAPVTVNSALAAINGFFSYYAWKDCRTKFLKVSRSVFCPENKEISKREYECLVKSAYKKGDDRIAMILQTICATGIRISEVPYITSVSYTHLDVYKRQPLRCCQPASGPKVLRPGLRRTALQMKFTEHQI